MLAKNAPNDLHTTAKIFKVNKLFKHLGSNDGYDKKNSIMFEASNDGSYAKWLWSTRSTVFTGHLTSTITDE